MADTIQQLFLLPYNTVVLYVSRTHLKCLETFLFGTTNGEVCDKHLVS